ncbi:cyclin-dependent protein kinase [Saitoella coloradoensis]
MEKYYRRKDAARAKVLDKYEIQGFISSGTYGRVYKARSKDPDDRREFAIKKFKPEREGEVQYTGLSQSAIREMGLCNELKHVNIIALVEVILEEKCIYMIFEYADHDLLQIIQTHVANDRRAIPMPIVKSIMYQLLNATAHLHAQWILHRDIKPANIMVTSPSQGGTLKVGDLGLARLARRPLHSLTHSDKVVVTIWYRPPELLLNASHYGPAVDIWSIGCTFLELLALKPAFKGEEVRMGQNTGTKKHEMPFQKSQCIKILEILGTPGENECGSLKATPEWRAFRALKNYPPRLSDWYRDVGKATDPHALDLIEKLLIWDPNTRISASEALKHPFFSDIPEGAKSNCFHLDVHDLTDEGRISYPRRKITVDEADIKTVGSGMSNPGKTGAAPGAVASVVSAGTTGVGTKRKAGGDPVQRVKRMRE